MATKKVTKESLKNLEKGKWKEGQSGNPAGKKPGTRNRGTIVREILSRIIDLNKLNPKQAKNLVAAGLSTKGSIEELITLSQVIEAAKGNTSAYDKLMNSAYGFPKQALDHTNDGDKFEFPRVEFPASNRKPKDNA